MSNQYTSSDPIERFINRIDVLENGCWQWTGSLASEGYGKFEIGDRQYNSHRFAYWLYKGEIPKGLHLDHLCRNRGCVNPDHMEPVTVKVNVLRGVGPSARNASKIECPMGHKYSGVNNKGKRICRICMDKSSKKFMDKKKMSGLEAAEKDCLAALIAFKQVVAEQEELLLKETIKEF